jgi:hypothetical protein
MMITEDIIREHLERVGKWDHPTQFHFPIDPQDFALVWIVHEFASSSLCARVGSIYEANKSLAGDDDTDGFLNPVLAPSALASNALFAEVECIKTVAQRILRSVRSHYAMHDLSIAHIALTKVSTGQALQEHADNADYICRFHGDHQWRDGDCDAGYWTPITGSEAYDFSVVLFLNDDFHGGPLHFPQYDFYIQPTCGTLVAFPSNRHFLHGVDYVVAGARYALAIWLTQAQ